MATNSYFTQGTTGEQDLVGSLVTEQIKMFGKDVYYIPRTLVNRDSVFEEDSLSAFNGAYLICLLYTSPSPRDKRQSRMPSSA